MKENKVSEPRYQDNRDIRDRNYQGDLIVESNKPFAVNKDQALLVIKRVIEHDISHYERKIEAAKNQITLWEEQIKYASDRLEENILKNIIDPLKLK